MKVVFMLTVLVVTASTASSYVCPSSEEVSQSCKQLNVHPLVCSNPKVNADACNAKQCNQPYIDNYAACQCRNNASQFYEHSTNVQGLIRRCGGAFENPYGDPSMYPTGGGTATVTSTSTGDVARATNIYDGTTYFGGQTGVVSGTTRIVNATAVVHGTTILPGTTTWVSSTPGIVSGTSTIGGPSMTAQPIQGPTPTETSLPVTESYHVSGGSIAGIVLGLVGAAILAGLFAVCWRSKRTKHIPSSGKIHIPHRPTQTVVTEKIEPVVVRKVPADQTNYAGSVPAARP